MIHREFKNSLEIIVFPYIRLSLRGQFFMFSQSLRRALLDTDCGLDTNTFTPLSLTLYAVAL